MKASTPLCVRASSIPTDGNVIQLLVELTRPQPPDAVLAIALDVSDSCGPLRKEAARLSRLVTHLSRDMPIWLFRLSSYEPSSQDGHRIAHLQDGSLELLNWFDDSRINDLMTMRGSLLRPVLDSVVERKVKEHVSHVKLLVLTDGELLDAGELNVPEGVSVVGLAPSSKDPKCKHWRRVLPTVPIFDLLDRRLDSIFADLATPYYGACEVYWRTSESTLTSMVVDLPNRQVRSIDGPHVWNSIDHSLMLLFKSPKPAALPPTLVCKSIKSGESIELKLPPDIDPLDSSIAAEVGTLLKAPTAAEAEIILDVSAANPQFASIRSQFLAARSLAESRGSWIDVGGIAKVWKEDAAGQALLGVDGRFQYDALICLASLEPSDPKRERIMVFALDKKHQPALRLGPELSIEHLTISFDHREARWMACGQGLTRELDPRGSQVVALSTLPGQDLPLVALFSGPLR